MFLSFLTPHVAIGAMGVQEAEDAMASLRKRLEQQLPPDTDKELAEKRRISMQQQQNQQKAKENPLKPPRLVLPVCSTVVNPAFQGYVL